MEIAFSKKQLKIAAILAVVLAVIAAIVIINPFKSLPQNQGPDAAAGEEASSKPKISFVSITVPDCAECNAVEGLVASLKTLEVSIESEKTLAYDSAEAKELIQKYSIEKVPALIISGETSKNKDLSEAWPQLGTVESDGALVLRNIPPVYLDLKENIFKGRVSMIRLTDSACVDCSETFSQGDFESAQVKIVSFDETDISSADGKQLMEKYGLIKAPTVILSKEIADYAVFEQLKTFGSIAEDGSLVFTSLVPPYHNLESNEVLGLIDAVFVVDSNCSECADVNTLIGIFTGSPSLPLKFGIVREVFSNSAEGKKLISQYSLNKLPSAVFSNDVYYYQPYFRIDEAWPSIGFIAEDNNYVFSKPEGLGVTYKDIESGEIIFPEQPGEVIQ